MDDRVPHVGRFGQRHPPVCTPTMATHQGLDAQVPDGHLISDSAHLPRNAVVGRTHLGGVVS